MEIYDKNHQAARLVFGSKHVLAPNNLVDFLHTPILEHLQLSLQQETVKQSEAIDVGILLFRLRVVITDEQTAQGCPGTRGQALVDDKRPV